MHTHILVDRSCNSHHNNTAYRELFLSSNKLDKQQWCHLDSLALVLPVVVVDNCLGEGLIVASERLCWATRAVQQTTHYVPVIQTSLHALITTISYTGSLFLSKCITNSVQLFPSTYSTKLHTTWQTAELQSMVHQQHLWSTRYLYSVTGIQFFTSVPSLQLTNGLELATGQSLWSKILLWGFDTFRHDIYTFLILLAYTVHQSSSIKCLTKNPLHRASEGKHWSKP